MRILIGLLVIAFGAVMVIKTEPFYGMTGPIAFAETHLGTGGTRLFLKLIGMGFVFVALVYMTGGLGDFGHAVLTPTIPTGQ